MAEAQQVTQVSSLGSEPNALELQSVSPMNAKDSPGEYKVPTDNLITKGKPEEETGKQAVELKVDMLKKELVNFKTPSEDISLLPVKVASLLGPETANATNDQLKAKVGELQNFLGRVLELLKEKTNMCANFEKQNSALTKQAKSLKEVVAITKDMLGIRNMEVGHLKEDVESMQKKINDERERHNSMITKMDHASKLNDGLKNEYLKQLEIFQDLRSKYEEKVALLTAENQRLQLLALQTNRSISSNN